MTHNSAIPGLTNIVAQRRQRRLERQLLALRTMEKHLRFKDIVCAVLAIPALVGLCLLVAAKLHFFSGSVPLTIFGSVAFGVTIWWMGRRSFMVAVLMVYALLMILFEDVPGDVSDFGSDRKEARRIKVERAIARREALLRTLRQDFR